MRIVRWTTPARMSAERYLDMLLEHSPASAARARLEIEGASRRFVYMPIPGRPSQRWKGRRELSLGRWNKLIVFEILPDQISVLAFLDMRQNLDAVILPEDQM